MSFYKKHQQGYLIAKAVAFISGSVMWLYKYSEEGMKMDLFGGIVFGFLAVFGIEELYSFYKNRKSEQVKSNK